MIRKNALATGKLLCLSCCFPCPRSINNLGKNRLYHNEGDGTFSIVKKGPIVEAGLRTFGTGWADYDNDGDLDLLILNGSGSKFAQPIELFRNEGGSNHWITIKPIGTISNRSAIGAKVWVRARIQGSDITQLREIKSDGTMSAELRAHFGLGDATVVDTLRIEWPSGVVQEFHDVPVDQILTIEEEGTAVNKDPRGLRVF